ncbi:MAG: hypothetical protein JXB50_08770 [Spirochaetes bacterium]|nr:hypothetical protein [Spirochaetota bacterium]
MIKKFLVFLIFNFNIFCIFSADKVNFNFMINYQENNSISNSQFKKNVLINFQDDKKTEKEKTPIFDKPDFSWFKEKNRLEKIFIAAGVITCTAGAGILLAGLINLLVNFNAVSIGGEPILNSYIVYYTLIGVGSGLIAIGTPFIIVGSVRLGRINKKIKTEVTLNNFRLN